MYNLRVLLITVLASAAVKITKEDDNRVRLFLRKASVEVVKEGFFTTFIGDIGRSVDDVDGNEWVTFKVNFQNLVRDLRSSPVRVSEFFAD